MMPSNPPTVCTLLAFYETGTEGVFWSICDNNKTGYDALAPLKNGDYLFVEDGKGKIEWEGTVALDYDTNRISRPTNPNYKQQSVAGYWVHGLQIGVDPELWASWFLEERPAVVIKGE